MFRLAPVFFLLAGVAHGQELMTGHVVSVIDGDTLSVMTATGKVKVRLYGIDCPESDQPYGSTATGWMINKVAGGVPVVVEVVTIGHYGRMVAWVYVNGENLNVALVRSGLAWHYVKYSKDHRLAEAEAMARNRGAGLWHDAEPVAPWAWRRGQR